MPFYRRAKGFEDVSPEVFDTIVEGESLTKQSEFENSDIHCIMRKYWSGALVNFQQREGQYGDFDGPDDLLSALTRVQEAKARFMELPSDVRDYVKNDPVELLRLVQDETRMEECERLGLVSEAALKSRIGAREEAARVAREARRSQLLEDAEALGLQVSAKPVTPEKGV